MLPQQGRFDLAASGALAQGAMDLLLVRYEDRAYLHYDSVRFVGGDAWEVAMQTRERVGGILRNCPTWDVLQRGEADLARALVLSVLLPAPVAETRCIEHNDASRRLLDGAEVSMETGGFSNAAVGGMDDEAVVAEPFGIGVGLHRVPDASGDVEAKDGDVGVEGEWGRYASGSRQGSADVIGGRVSGAVAASAGAAPNFNDGEHVGGAAGKKRKRPRSKNDMVKHHERGVALGYNSRWWQSDGGGGHGSSWT